jgi:outer membrane protein
LLIGVLTGVVAIVIVVLLLFFGDQSQSEEQGVEANLMETTTDVKASEVSNEVYDIAYIQTDSLLANYVFAKEANEKLLRQSEQARTQLQRKAQALQNDMVEFQKKLQTGSFLSQERAEAERDRILAEQRKLDQLDQKLSQDFLEERNRLNEQFKDSIDQFLKIFNADKRYKLILSNTMNDNVLYAADGLDITADVVKELNRRCLGKK